jgi:hypothetical protein
VENSAAGVDARRGQEGRCHFAGRLESVLTLWIRLAGERGQAWFPRVFSDEGCHVISLPIKVRKADELPHAILGLLIKVLEALIGQQLGDCLEAEIVLRAR